MDEMLMMIRDPHPDKNRDLTTWKLYENPFYNSQLEHHKPQHSARMIGASFWNIQSVMSSELENALSQLAGLRAKLALERKAHKKVEIMNKKLSESLLEEKKRRECMENLCEKMAKEITCDKSEIEKLKKGIEEERKMLRVAEILREERVQMKLTEAKILYQEKISELELTKKLKVNQQKPLNLQVGLCEKSNSNDIVIGWSKSCKRRLASPEAENPHIKRGIKGFVEFPRVVKAISSRGRQLGSKLEFQKSQLRLLLRQKSSIQPDNLVLD